MLRYKDSIYLKFVSFNINNKINISNKNFNRATEIRLDLKSNLTKFHALTKLDYSIPFFCGAVYIRHKNLILSSENPI